MKKTVIKFGLNSEDIDRAIKEVKQFKQEFLKKTERFVEGLAKIGLKEASVRFTTAMYDGINDVDVKLEEINNGFAIIAEGNAVAFIEFGAGVYHNTSEPYPNPRPSGVVGIGEYGQGKGKRNAWGYLDETGELVITRGNPAAMPMWYATTEMRDSITKLAKEVFG